VGGFKKFLLRGNVVDLAVGVVIGVAFSALITSFVAAFITPLLGRLSGAADFTNETFEVSGTTFPYGVFVEAVIAFVLIALVVYVFVVIPVQRMMDRYKTEPEAAAAVKECPECLSKIPAAAARCAFCTVEQLDVEPY